MVEAGKMAWSTTFRCNVDVVRVYRSTATVRVWGDGLLVGRLLTFRGQRLSTLGPRRRIARDLEGRLKYTPQGDLEYEERK